MVSYYNSLTYPQKHTGYPPVQSWFSPNYHPTSNHQLLSDIDPSHHQPVYYNPHHVFPQGPAVDWHNHETFSNQHSHHHHPHHPSHHQQVGHSATSTHHDLSSPNHIGGGGGGGGGGGSSIQGNNLHLTDITGNNSEASSSHGEGPGSGGSGGGGGGGSGNGNGSGSTGNNGMLPISPTLTKTELSSPTSNLTSLHIQISHHHQNKNHRSGLVKSPYYDWMKKPPYSTQNSSGKTRTKDKYRVVYTDFQRLELEKEYLTSRYITIRRKTELAQALQLSERQVKIWFQNRRAKERKQNKKRDENDSYTHSTSDHSIGQIVDSKSKIDSPANLSHTLHQMPMGMSSINLHHHPVLQSGHLTISPVHHTHHSPVSVQSLPM